MLLDREDREAIRVMGFWSWLYTGTLYRPVSRLMHRYNLHHCRVLGPFPDGSVQHWCEWCGLRYQTRAVDYSKLDLQMTVGLTQLELDDQRGKLKRAEQLLEETSAELKLQDEANEILTRQLAELRAVQSGPGTTEGSSSQA